MDANRSLAFLAIGDSAEPVLIAGDSVTPSTRSAAEPMNDQSFGDLHSCRAFHTMEHVVSLEASMDGMRLACQDLDEHEAHRDGMFPLTTSGWRVWVRLSRAARLQAVGRHSRPAR
jgi:hypothetical protein